MKRRMQKLGAISLFCLPWCAHASDIARIYLDGASNVHLLTVDGKDALLSKSGDAVDASLSKDGKTAAWLIEENLDINVASTPVTRRIVVYRDGRQRSITCEPQSVLGPFIRSYWFWKHGTRIAIDCGPMHFAGSEILYDTRTLKQLDRFDQASVPIDARPEWSYGSSRFSGD